MGAARTAKLKHEDSCFPTAHHNESRKLGLANSPVAANGCDARGTEASPNKIFLGGSRIGVGYTEKPLKGPSNVPPCPVSPCWYTR